MSAFTGIDDVAGEVAALPAEVSCMHRQMEEVRSHLSDRRTG